MRMRNKFIWFNFRSWKWMHRNYCAQKGQIKLAIDRTRQILSAVFLIFFFQSSKLSFWRFFFSFSQFFEKDKKIKSKEFKERKKNWKETKTKISIKENEEENFSGNGIESKLLFLIRFQLRARERQWSTGNFLWLQNEHFR